MNRRLPLSSGCGIGLGLETGMTDGEEGRSNKSREQIQGAARMRRQSRLTDSLSKALMQVSRPSDCGRMKRQIEEPSTASRWQHLIILSALLISRFRFLHSTRNSRQRFNRYLDRRIRQQPQQSAARGDLNCHRRRRHSKNGWLTSRTTGTSD